MRRTSFFLLVLLLASGFVTAGCASTGPYVWVDSINQAQDGALDVVIRDGDNISVRVFNQDNLSTTQPQKVRADGKIAIPVVGEVIARGKKPFQLSKELEEKFRAIVVAPSVSVVVEQDEKVSVSVVGEVKNSGAFQLEHGANVLHAIASAGGLSDFADSDKIFVVRKGMQQRVRFRYQDLRSAEARSLAFLLHSGDVVVVE